MVYYKGTTNDTPHTTTQEDKDMARFKTFNFTAVVGNTEALLKKDREIWLTGYGFRRYIRKGDKTYALYERGYDYSDINL